jgi:septal ring factor EnvC (AmiA/AmiB activator)
MKSLCKLSLAALLALSPLFLFPLSAFAQEDAPRQNPTLEELGSQIHTSLESLKQQSKDLTRELQERSSEVAELKTNLNELTICLDNTNQLLADYETKLIRYEEKLKGWRKFATVVAMVALLFLATRAVTLALRAKGIKLPEIVNILL